MKFKFLCITLLCLSMFSCNEDNTLVVEEELVELTSSNNLYIGDLYSIYLEREIDATNSLVLSLKGQIKGNLTNDFLTLQLEEASAKLETLQAQEVAQNNINDQVFRIPSIPRGPGPIPQPCLLGACADFPDFITIDHNIQNFSIVFRNAETQEEITSIELNQFKPLSQYNDILLATKIDFNGYVGNFSANIESIDVNGKQMNFSFNGAIDE